MISNKEILKQRARNEIYIFILEQPGLHLREVARKLNISYSSLRYHLKFLLKYDLITIKVDQNYKRYYATQKVGKEDKKLINIFRQEIPCRIILLLLCAGPGEIYQKKDASNELNPAIFLRTYSKKELVELTKYWKKPAADLFQLQKHRTTLDFHLDKLHDTGLIEKITAGREIKYRIKDENMIWAFFIRYQKTLSNKLIDKMMQWQDEGIENRIDAMIEAVFDILPHPYHV